MKNYIRIVPALFFIFDILLIIYLSIREEKQFPFLILLFIMNSAFLLLEIYQFTAQSAEQYFSEMWNYFDLGSFVLFEVYLIADVFDIEAITGSNLNYWFLLVSAFFIQIRTISMLRAIDNTRRLIRLIVEVIKDMTSFLLVLFIAIFSMAAIFLVIRKFIKV